MVYINNKKIIFFKSSARKTNASASVQYIIDHFNIDKIILIGTTAGINKKYNLGDIVLPTIFVNGDCDFIEKGESFKDKFITKIDLLKYNISSSITICSSDRPLIYKEDSILMNQNNVDIRDMEAYAVANICNLNKTELVVIKGITDYPGDYEEPSEEQYLEYKNNVPIVMEKILKEYLNKYI